MSIRSWKEEFYPPICISDMFDLGWASAHSLQKWEGLSRSNLTKHNVVLSKCVIEGKNGEYFVFSGMNCALCVRYYRSKKRGEECSTCPLYKTTGKACHHDDSAWSIWMATRNFRPMISALKEALIFERQQNES